MIIHTCPNCKKPLSVAEVVERYCETCKKDVAPAGGKRAA